MRIKTASDMAMSLPSQVLCPTRRRVPAIFRAMPVAAACRAINNHGDVAGEYSTDNPLDPLYRHGFMLHNGQRTVIDPPGSILTQLFGLNDSLEVSGFYYDATQIGHGYIYTNGQILRSSMCRARSLSPPSAPSTTTRSFVGEFVDGMGLTHGYIGTPVTTDKSPPFRRKRRNAKETFRSSSVINRFCCGRSLLRV